MRALEPDDPRSVGRHRILARIGTGGMAIVYFGRSAGGRAAAVKVMHAELAGDREHRERFRREVAATRMVGGRFSPGIIDADPDATIPWLATEFLPSVSLRDAVRRCGQLPTETVWEVAAGLVEALASIHGAGILHLDIKPSNVLLTVDGPRVIDFGLAGQLGAGGTPAAEPPAGSRGFMAPERTSGDWTGPPSDVYSLGATLAYVRTGGWRVSDIADDSLRAVISSSMRREPAGRPTVAELAGRVAAVRRGAGGLPPMLVAEIERQASEAENPPMTVSPVESRLNRRSLLAGGALAMAGGAAAATILFRGEPAASPKAPQPSTTPTPTPTTRPVTTPTRTLEFYIFGNTRLKSLTTTVNGQAVTVTNAKLPYRRVVTIPDGPRQTRWSFSYHTTKGNLVYKLLVDGVEYVSGNAGSSHDDMKDHEEGVI